MRLVSWVVTLGLGAALAAPALGEDSLSYDDPGMHFSAPAGWTRVDVSGAQGGQNAPVAAFVYHAGRSDAHSITITIVDNDQSLDAFERGHETDLRKASDGTFIQNREAMKLSNGMPVFFVKSSTSSDSGQFVARYEYVVIDGQRGITVSYAGNSSDTDEKSALAALSSLYVVAYPGHAPH